MKRLALIIPLITILSSIVQAQFSVPRQAFRIPFDFKIKETDFPAGRYTIERMNPSNPNFFIIRNAIGSTSVIFAASPGGHVGKTDMVMVFAQCGGNYRLARVTSASDRRIISKSPLRPNCAEEKGGRGTAIVRKEPT